MLTPEITKALALIKSVRDDMERCHNLLDGSPMYNQMGKEFAVARDELDEATKIISSLSERTTIEGLKVVAWGTIDCWRLLPDAQKTLYAEKGWKADMEFSEQFIVPLVRLSDVEAMMPREWQDPAGSEFDKAAESGNEILVLVAGKAAVGFYDDLGGAWCINDTDCATEDIQKWMPLPVSPANKSHTPHLTPKEPT